MHTRNLMGAVALSLTLLQTSQAQPPANDNFANRSTLAGDHLIFSGELTASTIESSEPTNFIPPYPNVPITSSLWWTWTAAHSGPVTITMLACSQDSYVPGLYDFTCALHVYAGTNIYGNPPASPLCGVWVNPFMNQPSVSFQAVAGSSYQFQFLGAQPALAATFELLATNGPVILDPPTDQTVFPNGSALFTVLAGGIPGFTYQWRFNGVDLPGQNDPMLALAYVTTDQAGSYSVLVSNASGTTLAGPAILSVNSNPIPPSLQLRGQTAPNQFALTLSGESGRYYQIESSTDLSAWKTLTNFPATVPPLTYPPGAVKYRRVVYCTNAMICLTVTNASIATFFRASLYNSFDENCEMHLKQIRFAKQLWQRTPPIQARTFTPAYSDLEPFWQNINSTGCPLVGGGGPFEASYTMNIMTSDPSCQVEHRHALLEPR